MNLLSTTLVTQAGRTIDKSVLLTTNRFQDYNDNTSLLSGSTNVVYTQKKFAGNPGTLQNVIQTAFATVQTAAEYSRPGINIPIPVLTTNGIAVNKTKNLSVDNFITVYEDPTTPGQSLILYEVPGKNQPDKIITSLTRSAIATLANKIFVEEGLMPSMTTTERNLLTPVAGQIIWNSTTVQFEGYDGTNWIAL